MFNFGRLYMWIDTFWQIRKHQRPLGLRYGLRGDLGRAGSLAGLGPSWIDEQNIFVASMSRTCSRRASIDGKRTLGTLAQ